MSRPATRAQPCRAGDGSMTRVGTGPPLARVEAGVRDSSRHDPKWTLRRRSRGTATGWYRRVHLRRGAHTDGFGAPVSASRPGRGIHPRDTEVGEHGRRPQADDAPAPQWPSDGNGPPGRCLREAIVASGSGGMSPSGSRVGPICDPGRLGVVKARYNNIDAPARRPPAGRTSPSATKRQSRPGSAPHRLTRRSAAARRARSCARTERADQTAT